VIGSPIIRELLKRATRAEAPVVEALAHAAGFLWRCQAYGCGTVNGDDRHYCEKCHQPRKVVVTP